ncbi:hypothetical protein J2S40_001580 [Nocardioides luteus]|uniref:Uncharacterized protein n=1 Tax=Nocardioides luteus TaxID=1844 RepID=A0ABQ5T0R4_9ACTN|nr:hypothetical protein [Nocardioides luteus]MDR7310522.1 hypothetical protein [Nocardioides luteus]GGR42264.1 hypothetical protein GCM10010197_04720 [Nocardioides luteus]GLJ69696.1 hypothetical protein GCM10017579_37320 [Nocardioides luteus]
MNEVGYVIGLVAVSAAVLALGVWFVRREIRDEVSPALVLWTGYAVVAAFVVFGVVRTSWVVLS